MNSLICFAVLVASAVAAPQAVIKRAYAPASYPYAAAPATYPYAAAPATYPYAAAPAAYSYGARPYAAPFAAAPAYARPYAAPYAAAAAPAYRPAAYPYAAPAATAYPYAARAAAAYAGAAARPAAILRQAQDNNVDGSFNSEFESENGISSSSSGFVRAISPEESAQTIQGQYAYTAPDGTPIVTRYYADENGFHADGAHIPVAPADPYRIA